MKKLANKVVFITGAASGIGKVSAIEAAREGASVVVADLPNSHYQDTMTELNALGVPSLFVPIDILNVDSIKQAIDATVKQFGRMDIALNNAGITSSYAEVHETDEALWQRIVDINLNGQFYCAKYELQQFLKQGGGVMVNMASLAGIKAEKGVAAYTAAKHGVLGLTKTIAVQYGDRNIRVNAVLPYYIASGFTGDMPPELRSAWEEGTPAKRLGTAEEVAKAFIYLASDDSSFCNGTQLIVDGGATC